MLVFYPFAFSPVCTDQLQLYEPLTRELAEAGDALYGVSCDSTWAQSAFREKLGVTSEQLSDFEPKGAACRAFGVLHEGGFPQRALVVTGPDGRRQLELPGRLAGRTPGPGPVAYRPAVGPRGPLSSLGSESEKETVRRPKGGTGRQ